MPSKTDALLALCDPTVLGVNLALLAVGCLGLIFAIIAVSLGTTDPTRGITVGPGLVINDQRIGLAPQDPGTLLGVAGAGSLAEPEPLGPLNPGSLLQGGPDSSITELMIGPDNGRLAVSNGICAWFTGPKAELLTSIASATDLLKPSGIAFAMNMDGAQVLSSQTTVPFSATYSWVSDGSTGAHTTGAAIIDLTAMLPPGLRVDTTHNPQLAGSGSVTPAGGPPTGTAQVAASFTATTLELRAAIDAALVVGDTLVLGVVGAVPLTQV